MGRKDGRTKGRTGQDWTDRRTNGRTDGRTDGRMGRTDGRIGLDERTEERADGRTNGRTGGRTDGWTEGRTDGWTDGRTADRLDERTDGWMNGRMDGRTDGHGSIRVGHGDGGLKRWWQAARAGRGVRMPTGGCRLVRAQLRGSGCRYGNVIELTEACLVVANCVWVCGYLDVWVGEWVGGCVCAWSFHMEGVRLPDGMEGRPRVAGWV